MEILKNGDGFEENMLKIGTGSEVVLECEKLPLCSPLLAYVFTTQVNRKGWS